MSTKPRTNGSAQSKVPKSDPFVQIDMRVVTDTRLTATDFRVYAMVKYFCFQNEHTWVGQETIAAALDISLKTVQRSMQALRGYGLLEVRRRGYGRTQINYLVHPKEVYHRYFEMPTRKAAGAADPSDEEVETGQWSPEVSGHWSPEQHGQPCPLPSIEEVMGTESQQSEAGEQQNQRVDATSHDDSTLGDSTSPGCPGGDFSQELKSYDLPFCECVYGAGVVNLDQSWEVVVQYPWIARLFVPIGLAQRFDQLLDEAFHRKLRNEVSVAFQGISSTRTDDVSDHQVGHQLVHALVQLLGVEDG